MKTILELQDDYSHLVKSAKDIDAKAEKENRRLTDGEAKDVDDFLARGKEVKKEIEAVEADLKRRAAIAAEMTALGTPRPRQTTSDPITDEPSDKVYATPKSYRFGRLKAFTGKDGETEAYRMGQWYRATIGNNFSAQRWCEKNGVDFRASMSEGTNTAGGVLVPNELSQRIIDLRETYGVFRREADIEPMAGDTKQIARVTGHLTAYFTGEGVAGTPSDMTLDQVGLVAKKLFVLNFTSAELEEDAIVSVIDKLAMDAAWALAYKEDLCGFAGTGAGGATYGGISGLTTRILDSANTAGAVNCATAGHDTFAEVDHADLAGLIAALPQYALPRAKFYCSQVAKSLVFGRLSATAGGNNVQTLQGSVGDNYLGYPIVVSQVLPTSTGNLNDLPMLFFGDLKLAATIGDRRGITFKRDDSIKFLEDQIAIKVTERLDINVHSLGDTSTAGPIVGLIGFTS